MFVWMGGWFVGRLMCNHDSVTPAAGERKCGWTRSGCYYLVTAALLSETGRWITPNFDVKRVGKTVPDRNRAPKVTAFLPVLRQPLLWLSSLLQLTVPYSCCHPFIHYSDLFSRSGHWTGLYYLKPNYSYLRNVFLILNILPCILQSILNHYSFYYPLILNRLPTFT